MLRLIVKRFAVTALLALAACQDPVDKAAKKRIFSPEDPPQAVAAASQKLPPEEVAARAEIARRVLGMGAAETTERIGAHTLNATISWEWTAVGKNVRLKESRELLAGPGGVGGDFFARLTNDHDQGLEVIRVDNKVFARTTYGKDGAGRYRQRLRDRGMAERIREEAFGGIRDFDGLFRGRLVLAEQGTVSFEGRTAWRYAVSLGPQAPDAPSKLPPVQAPKNGVDATTRLRQRFFEGRQPTALQGEVLVDAQTSVVLKARLDGRIGVAADGGDGADLRLVLEQAMSGIGKAPVIKAPDDALPDEDKPLGIAAALERFGVKRTADGGVPAPKADELPDEVE